MRLAGRVAASLGSRRLAESLGPCQLHTDWRDDDINIIWDYSDVFFINISSDLIEYSYNLGLKDNVLTFSKYWISHTYNIHTDQLLPALDQGQYVVCSPFGCQAQRFQVWMDFYQ